MRFFLLFSETMESLMTDHCNAFAARAVGAPFPFGAPFGLPAPPPHLAGMPGFDFAAAAAQADPAMAAILRERAMLLGFGAGGPQALANQIPGFAGRLPPGMGPNPFGMAPPPVNAGAHPQFWSQSKPQSEAAMNEQMYQMQQQQWYQALAAANGGRLPPGSIPPPPTSAPNGPPANQLQFAAQLAAMNPSLWAAMAAYGNNGSVPPGIGPNPNMAKMMSPTFLKTMQLEQEAMHGKATPESPRKEHLENSQVAAES